MASEKVGMTADRAAQGRDAPFGYVCQRCNRCCHGINVPLDPYEIARLARRLGETTTSFRNLHTEDGAGTCLRHTETGACVLLGPDGCTVHEDRPLGCRVYPLALELNADGSERWSHHVPHPQSPGDYTITGTAADYLAGQNIERHLRAFGEYTAFVRRARACLAAGPASVEPRSAGCDLVDMDVAIARHCAARGDAEPSDIEARKSLHLHILYDLLDDLSKLPDNEGHPDCQTNPTTGTRRQTAKMLLAAVASLSTSLGMDEAEAESMRDANERARHSRVTHS
jgi:Fe-S-cluster containining protein